MLNEFLVAQGTLHKIASRAAGDAVADIVVKVAADSIDSDATLARALRTVVALRGDQALV